MYLPAHFREDDRDTLFDFIRVHAFGLLVTQTSDGPFATHLPFLLEEGPDGQARLLGHLAKANPQGRHLADGGTALAMFWGPHAYVSPGWYAQRAGNVPTWNYTAVHVSGRPVLLEEPAEIDRLLEALSAKYEAGQDEPWSLGELDAKQKESLRRGIVAFALPVERIEGKFKLSQNRKDEDRAGVIRGLKAAGDPDSLATARLMAER